MVTCEKGHHEYQEQGMVKAGYLIVIASVLKNWFSRIIF
jgi:hypothetical protein